MTFFCIQASLRGLGFLVEPEIGEDGVTTYVKLSVPFNLLCQQAEKTRLRMPLLSKEIKVMNVPSFADKYLKAPKFINNIFDNHILDDEDIVSAPFKTAHLEVRPIYVV
jgi:hypothetical protein